MNCLAMFDYLTMLVTYRPVNQSILIWIGLEKVMLAVGINSKGFEAKG